MTVARTVELEGHIIDSGMMETCFGIIMDMGGSFEVEEFAIGRHKTETSYARLQVEADDEATLQSIVHELHQNGANPADPMDATLEPAPADSVVPPGFYSTTNHPTDVRYDGEWVPVGDIEMDCAVVVETDGEPTARTEVLSAVEAGDLIVTGDAGIRVKPPDRPRGQEGAFGFMQGGISSERPSESTISKIAEAIAETNREDGEVLAVCGPALIHSGAREAFARLVREGYVDMLSIGNGFAVHDLERDLYGTSLGMDTESLDHPRKGHKHHIY
ncbi:TIGR00300 family protein, partial [Halobacteriales archaeon SW_10_66_29]